MPFACFVILVFLTSCVKNSERNGVVLDDFKKDDFVLGSSSKEDVLNSLSRPSFEMDDGSFVYVDLTKQWYGFLNAKVSKSKIVIVKFDSNDKVFDINQLDDSLSGINISPEFDNLPKLEKPKLSF